MLMVKNSGSAERTVSGIALPAGVLKLLVYTGGSWNAVQGTGGRRRVLSEAQPPMVVQAPLPATNVLNTGQIETTTSSQIVPVLLAVLGAVVLVLAAALSWTWILQGRLEKSEQRLEKSEQAVAEVLAHMRKLKLETRETKSADPGREVNIFVGPAGA